MCCCSVLVVLIVLILFFSFLFLFVVALGHPLGCTGARQIATLLSELKRSGGKLGVVSMCIGTGMGAAGIFELE